MTLGIAPTRQRFENPREVLGDRLAPGSLYRLLADQGQILFPDDYFADCYSGSLRGRPTVPARVLATTMVLQSFEGLSDREACDRLEVDLRWQAAAGVDIGAESFHPTVLVGQHNRLRASLRPRRLFEDTTVVAKAAGAMKGRARVLDSTPLYDAVATQDTVTQLRAAIRKLLGALGSSDPTLAEAVRASLCRDNDYATPGKPPCDWDDPSGREALIDKLVRDAMAAIEAIEGRPLDRGATDAAELLAPVADEENKPVVVGDSAYADGATRAHLAESGFEVVAKVPPVRNATGGFTKDRFDIDLDAATVTCPAEVTVELRPTRNGGRRARFALHCSSCPLASQCTNSPKGRSVSIGPYEAELQGARSQQQTPEWTAAYRSDRPIVERKIAHLVRRPWGGRKARCRGLARIAADLETRAGAINLARLATLGLTFGDEGWALEVG